VREIDCGYVEDHDLAALYLAGKLAEGDAEVFEAHQFACDRCSAELAQVSEIRAALGKPVLVPDQPARRTSSVRRDAWTLLAAAAAVAIVALGIRQLVGRPAVVPKHEVLRGQKEALLDLSLKAGPGGHVVLEWPPDPDARSYRVKILRSDGHPVLTSETSDTRMELNVGALPPRPPGVSFLATIEALDAMNGVVAKSGLKPLAVP